VNCQQSKKSAVMAQIDFHLPTSCSMPTPCNHPHGIVPLARSPSIPVVVDVCHTGFEHILIIVLQVASAICS
jgi:hypothetical protein